MTRGFTLLELVIVIGLISMTLLWAIPSFRSVSETANMTRLASELYGFIVQAKSQARLRRQPLWVHIFQSGQNWELRLTDDQDRTQGRLITKLSGLSFKGISLFSNHSANRISFDASHGRPKSGSLVFYPSLTPELTLELRTHFRSAMVRVCAPNTPHLGYDVC